MRKFVHTLGNFIGEEPEPGQTAHTNSCDIYTLAGKVDIHKFMRDDCAGHCDPEKQDYRVEQNAHKTDRERVPQMQFIFDILSSQILNCNSSCQKVVQPQNGNQQKTHQFHDGSYHVGIKQMRESRKGCHAVDQFHGDRAHTNSERGTESHFSALIHDRDVDRPHGNRCDQSAEETREKRFENKKKGCGANN